MRRGGFLLFGITEAPAAEARGPLSLWDHRGPHRWGEGAYFALGPPGPPPLRLGGLRLFRTTEAPAAEARGLLALWDHGGPRR